MAISIRQPDDRLHPLTYSVTFEVNETHGHTFREITYLTGGEAQDIVNGIPYNIKKCSVVFLGPMHYHRYHVRQGTKYEHRDIYVAENVFRTICGALGEHIYERFCDPERPAILTLTEDGMILRKRAEEIVALMEKTKAEINASAENITGDIYIGCAETEGMRMLAKIISKIRQEYDHIHFHIFSGQAEDVSERLDSGLLDFGLFIEPADLKKYDFIKLPITDIWGLWMTKASPLAENKTIKPHDLLGLPLIISNQAMVKNEIAGWMGGNYDNLNIVATYNLLYNASLMVEEGVGYALSIDRIIKSYDDSPLCFRPLEPTLEVGLDIVWKKYQTFSKASEKFLEYLKKEYI